MEQMKAMIDVLNKHDFFDDKAKNSITFPLRAIFLSKCPEATVTLIMKTLVSIREFPNGVFCKAPFLLP